MQKLEWDDFRLVKMISEHRALAPAAEALKLNHSTVFRKLNALEEGLGVRIFERSRSGYALTTAGEEMLAVAVQMAESVVDFERRMAGLDSRPTGEVRVTTTESLFFALLAPILPEFRRKYPGITLDVLVDNRSLNLSRRDADVALRAVIEPPETLVGRKIADMPWCIYSSRTNPVKSEVRDIFTLDVPWLAYGEPVSQSYSGRWLAGQIPAEKVVVRVNSVGCMLKAIECGLGIGALPCFYGDAEPGIQAVCPPLPGSMTALWLLTHPDLRRSVKVRAFLDYVGVELSKRRRSIEGAG